MKQNGHAAERDLRYRRAGLVYGVLGAVILALTVATPELLNPERRVDLIHLLVGLPFFVVFALAIAFGDRAVALLVGVVAGREWALKIGRGFQLVLTMLLTLSALGRTFVFAANGVGTRPRLVREPWRLVFESAEVEPRMLVNALLMAVIAVFLAWASWWPLRRGFAVEAPGQGPFSSTIPPSIRSSRRASGEK